MKRGCFLYLQRPAFVIPCSDFFHFILFSRVIHRKASGMIQGKDAAGKRPIARIGETYEKWI
jgi:hypothetical protein